MEPGIREFFKRLALSIGLCVVWMAINTTIGIRYGFAFFEGQIRAANIIFYVWVIASFIALLWLYMKIWKNPIEHL